MSEYVSRSGDRRKKNEELPAEIPADRRQGPRRAIDDSLPVRQSKVRKTKILVEYESMVWAHLNALKRIEMPVINAAQNAADINREILGQRVNDLREQGAALRELDGFIDADDRERLDPEIELAWREIDGLRTRLDGALATIDEHLRLQTAAL